MLFKYLHIWIFLKMCWCEHKVELEDENQLRKKYLIYFVKASVLKPEDDTWVCGGALVSPTQILTAAACLVDVGEIYAIAGYGKYVNSRNIDKDPCTRVVKRKVVKINVPKEYNSSKGQKSWPNVDIGVAVVDKPYNLSNAVYNMFCSYEPDTIEINFDKEKEMEKTRAIALSWGKPKPNNGIKSRSLEEISTIIVEKKSCKMYSNNTETKNIIKKYLKCVSTTARLEQEERKKNNKSLDLNTDCVNSTDMFFNVRCFSRRNEQNKTTIISKGNKTKSRTHINSTIIRRTAPIGKCQYGHGNPLVTWVGYREMVIGVSLKSASDYNHHCNSLYLYVSTSHASQIIKCLLEMDPKARALCNKNITEERYKANEISVRWPNGTKIKHILNSALVPLQEINETQPLASNKTQVSIQNPNIYRRAYNLPPFEKPYLSGPKYLPDRSELSYDRVNSGHFSRETNVYPQINPYSPQQGNSLNQPKFYEQPQPPQEFYRPPQVDMYSNPHENFGPPPIEDKYDQLKLKLYKRPQDNMRNSLPQKETYNLNDNNYNHPNTENHNQRFVESFRQPTVELLNQGSVDMYQQHTVNGYLPPVPIAESEPSHLPTSYDHQQQFNILRQLPPSYERMYSQLNAPIVDNVSPLPEETFHELYRNMHDPALSMPNEESMTLNIYHSDREYERPLYDSSRLYEPTHTNFDQPPSFYQPPEHQFGVQRDLPIGWQQKPQAEEQHGTQFEMQREPRYGEESLPGYERQEPPVELNQWHPPYEESRAHQYEVPQKPQFENRWQPQFEGQQQPQYEEQWHPQFEERREPELVDQRLLELQRDRLFDEHRTSQFEPQHGSSFNVRPEPQYKELRSPQFEKQKHLDFGERRDPQPLVSLPSQYENLPGAQRGSLVEERRESQLVDHWQPKFESHRETRLVGQMPPKLKAQPKPISEEQKELRFEKPHIPQLDGPVPPRAEGSRLPQVEELQAPRFEDLQTQQFEEKRETRFEERKLPRLEDARQTRLPLYDESKLSRFEEPRTSRIEDPQLPRFDGPQLARFEESHRPRYEERRETRFKIPQLPQIEEPRKPRFEEKRERFDLPELPKFEEPQETRFLEHQVPQNEKLRDPLLDKLKLPSYYNQRPPFHQRRDQQFEVDVETYFSLPTETTELPQFEEPQEPRFERPWQERFEQPVEVTLLEKLAPSNSKEELTGTQDLMISSTSEANSVQEEIQVRPQLPIRNQNISLV